MTKLNKIDVVTEAHGDIDAILERLEHDLRHVGLSKGIRAANNVVIKDARSRLPKPGYPGDKPGYIPLAKTIIGKVKVYEAHVVGIVGPAYLGVNHGHLVEFGHRMIRKVKTADGVEVLELGFVPPHPFLRPAHDETIPQQQDAIVAALSEFIATAGAGQSVFPART